MHKALILLVLGSTAATATDLPRIFMTSTAGTGNLSTWADAHGQDGLAAADEICRTRAAAVGIANAGEYIAFLSDSHDDAYCRVHGLGGKRADQCDQEVLPTGAGPWYRMDDKPAVDIVQNSMGPHLADHYVPLHVLYDETGTALPSEVPSTVNLAFNSTKYDGTLSGDLPPCGDWKVADPQTDIELRSAYRGYESAAGFGWQCNRQVRLTCLERGQHGDALTRKRPPTARLAFLSSVEGPGTFADWPQSGGTAGVNGADAVCRSLATTAGLPLPSTYRAWLATDTGTVQSRFEHDGPWYRVDGVRIAGSLADLFDGVIDAPMQLDEYGKTIDFANVWTGAYADGTPYIDATCGSWVTGGKVGTTGLNPAADAYWAAAGGGPPCDAHQAVYCFADNDSMFLDGFDP